MKRGPIVLIALVTLMLLIAVCIGAFFLGYRSTLAYQAKNNPTPTITEETEIGIPLSTSVLPRDDDQRLSPTQTPVDNSLISNDELEALIPILEGSENLRISNRNTHIEYTVEAGLGDSFYYYLQELESRGWEIEKSQNPDSETGIATITATNADGYTVVIQLNKAKADFKLMVTIDLSGLE